VPSAAGVRAMQNRGRGWRSAAVRSCGGVSSLPSGSCFEGGMEVKVGWNSNPTKGGGEKYGEKWWKERYVWKECNLQVCVCRGAGEGS